MNDDKEYKVIGKGIEGSEESGKDRELGYAEVSAPSLKKTTEAPTLKPDEMVKQSVSENIQQHCAAIPEPDVQVKIEVGEPTTSFSHDIKAAYKGTEAIASGVSGIVSEGVNMTGAAVNSVVNNIGMALQLTNSVIDGATKFVTVKTEEIATALVSYVAKLPVDILSYQTSYITNCLPQIQTDIINEITKQSNWTDWQDNVKELQEKTLEKAQKEAQMNKQFKGVEKIQKCLGKVKSKMEKITDHINEGGTFIQSKTQELVDNTFDEITNTSNKVVIAIAEQEAKQAEEWGNKLGKKSVEKQAKKLKKTLQEQMKTIEKAKQKGMVEAAKAKAIAISKITAIMGL